MATSSILRDLNITKKSLARGYVEALEQAASSKPIERQNTPSASQTVKTLKKDEIKSFFEAIK